MISYKDLKGIKIQKKEIKRLENKIEELKAQVTSITPTYSDMPKGSGKTSYQLEDLIDRQNALMLRKMTLEADVRMIERFIGTIHDAVIRNSVELRYLECFSWQRVALELGGNNTPDGVRMMTKRYLKKCFKQ